MTKEHKRKKNNKQINPRRKIEQNKINEWIKAQKFEYKIEKQIIAKLNKLSTDNISYLANNLGNFTKDTFNAKLANMSKEQKNSSKSGAKPMTTENTEKTSNNPDIRDTEEFKTFIHENPHIRTEDQIEAYKLQKENPEAFNIRFAPENKNNQETEKPASTSPSNEEDKAEEKQKSDTNTSKKITISDMPLIEENSNENTNNQEVETSTPASSSIEEDKTEEEQKLDTDAPKSALVSDIPITEHTQEEHTEEQEKTPWSVDVIKKYQEKYNTEDKENVTHEPLGEGVHIEVAPHSKDEQQLTGTAVNYHTEDHIEIQKTKNGVEPKDQSYQHFLDHMEILQKREFEEIELGRTSSPEFRTKLIAAALANNLKINTPLKEEDTISLSDKTLKEIPETSQTDLLKFALENDVKLEFGENSPLLDFNNEAVQALPDKLKYKYMATLLQNEDTKDKIKNAPKVEFFTTNNTKDEEGNDVFNPDGTPKTTNEPNPALNELNKDELSTLRIFNRQQQITELRGKVIGQNPDGSNITAGDMHDKINALRNRDEGGTRTFKTEAGQEKTIKTITKEQRETNMAKLEQLRAKANQNR